MYTRWGDPSQVIYIYEYIYTIFIPIYPPINGPKFNGYSLNSLNPIEVISPDITGY